MKPKVRSSNGRAMRCVVVHTLPSSPFSPSHKTEGSICAYLILLMIISSRDEENSSVAIGADFEALTQQNNRQQRTEQSKVEQKSRDELG